MTGIAGLAGELLLTAIINEKIMAPRKSGAAWILAALSVLLAGTGVVFLGLALDRHLENMYAPDRAAFIAGVFVLAVAFLAGAAAWFLRRRKAAHSRLMRAELGRNVRELVQAVCDELDDPVRENPKTALLAAAMAGFLATGHYHRI